MMNKIVAISDPHLGQTGLDTMGQYSLLSTRARGNRVASFAQAVARYAAGDKVSLIVAGDFLDLSLSYMEDALIDLRGLLEAVKLDEIIYPIGNHDIKLWELHCEEKNLLGDLRSGRIPASQPGNSTNKALYHITPNAGEPFTLLQRLIDEIYGAGKVPIKIAYPSYTVELPHGELVYFTHGHLDAELYTAISDLLQDKLAAFPHDRVAATVNEPLISLIYWLLGEMGEGMGADGFIEHVYTDLQKGDDGKVKDLVERLVAKLLPDGIFQGIPDSWERAALVKFIMKLLASGVLSKPATGASRDRHAETTKTLDELWKWIKAVSPLKERIGDKIHPTTVVFGHVHELILNYRYPDTAITAWNLGTWLIEPGHESPRTGFLGIDGSGATTWVDVN